MTTTDNTVLAPAAERFKQLQAESERLPFDEIKSYLRASSYDVLERTDNEPTVNERFGYATLNEDEFRVTHDWTEKGVRYQWAQQKFLDLLTEYEENRFPRTAAAESTELLPREKRVNEAFAERVGQRIDSALLCIERARRLADVCSAAIKALEVENSGDIAFTMGSELFEAIDDARKALAGEA